MGGRNFGNQARSKQKRDTVNAHAEFEERQKWVPPADLERDPGIWEQITETARILVISSRTKSKPSRIADYVILQHTHFKSEWHQVIRVDCAHSQVHRHGPEFTEAGRLRRTVIRDIFSQDDVEATYNEQRASVFTNFEDAERKWHDTRTIHNVSSSQLLREIDEDDIDESTS